MRFDLKLARSGRMSERELHCNPDWNGRMTKRELLCNLDCRELVSVASVPFPLRVLYPLMALLGLTLAGCTLQVSSRDLVGDWRMTEEGIQQLGLRGLRPGFKLNADGSLIAENVPSSAFRDSRAWRSMFTGAGAWTTPATRRIEGFASLVLDFRQTEPDRPTGLTLQVDRDSSGLYLFTWLDEEGGERLIYRR